MNWYSQFFRTLWAHNTTNGTYSLKPKGCQFDTSLAALLDCILTTAGAASDETVVTVMTIWFPFCPGLEEYCRHGPGGRAAAAKLAEPISL